MQSDGARLIDFLEVLSKIVFIPKLELSLEFVVLNVKSTKIINCTQVHMIWISHNIISVEINHLQSKPSIELSLLMIKHD